MVGSKTATLQHNSKRQGDLGSVALIDLTVSDGGGCNPGPNYVPGDHRQRNATAKRANYLGDNARFMDILYPAGHRQRNATAKQLSVTIWGARRISSCRL